MSFKPSWILSVEYSTIHRFKIRTCFVQWTQSLTIAGPKGSERPLKSFLKLINLIISRREGLNTWTNLMPWLLRVFGEIRNSLCLRNAGHLSASWGNMLCANLSNLSLSFPGGMQYQTCSKFPLCKSVLGKTIYDYCELLSKMALLHLLYRSGCLQEKCKRLEATILVLPIPNGHYGSTQNSWTDPNSFSQCLSLIVGMQVQYSACWVPIFGINCNAYTWQKDQSTWDLNTLKHQHVCKNCWLTKSNENSSPAGRRCPQSIVWRQSSMCIGNKVVAFLHHKRKVRKKRRRLKSEACLWCPKMKVIDTVKVNIFNMPAEKAFPHSKIYHRASHTGNCRHITFT